MKKNIYSIWVCYPSGNRHTYIIMNILVVTEWPGKLLSLRVNCMSHPVNFFFEEFIMRAWLSNFDD